MFNCLSISPEGLFGKQDEMQGHILENELNSLDPRNFENIQDFFTSGLCCSKWGYCGTTSDYCGNGCQSGPCYSSGGGSPSGGGGIVGTIISRSFFNALVRGGRSVTPNSFFNDPGGGSPSGSVGTIISQSFFDGVANGVGSSCEGKGFYTYNAFISTANAYSGFDTAGSNDVKKRELAAFFANVMHVTRGLCYINEKPFIKLLS